MKLFIFTYATLLLGNSVSGGPTDNHTRAKQVLLVPVLDENFGMNCDLNLKFERDEIIKKIENARSRLNSVNYPPAKFCHPNYPGTKVFYFRVFRYRLENGCGADVNVLLSRDGYFLGVLLTYRNKNRNRIKHLCSFTASTSFYQVSEPKSTIGHLNTTPDPRSTRADIPTGQTEDKWHSFSGLKYPVIENIMKENGVVD
ncbi:BgtAcSP-30622 [Blumeria graminis f. sp. tritici]|uniref:BgtAcSP-30622 n=2 Tax=Blumeria graminis f. sp. tritici TaxID=62690 RepID=A0A9X9LBI8_BLUGR|nr:hypothetical protein BGT96224_AcSP30622 [Blumeria graminis f. sp. tritici 96224]VCU41320.1 BgtAcSP-30622 [Blumeria graminis f. sp. tritici]